MVGCVLVKNGVIIGEGFHHVFGGPHAEVEAVNSVKNKADIEGATAYVSLEPCAHFGKTPPCANLLVEHKVAKVVICNRDPHSKVDGKGAQILKDAGTLVVSGVLPELGRHLNRYFFTFHEKKRPYVILKWAQTSDGFIAPEEQESGHSFPISNDFSNQYTHKLRTEVDAILIGKHTFAKDLPGLNSRHFSGKSPIKVILDSKLEFVETIKETYANQGKTLILNSLETSSKSQGVKLVQCNMTAAGILDCLYKEQIQSALVEGGKKVLEHFIDTNLWDEAKVITGKNELKTGITAPSIIDYQKKETYTHAQDNITHYFNA